MKPKRTILIKLACLACAFALLSLAGMPLYRGLYAQTSDGAYWDKLDRLQTLAEAGTPKAVFVGGSATHFGIHAALFEEETGIPAVNMGLNAGLSFQMCLDSVSPWLQPGDLLFLMPEYDYYAHAFQSVNENSVNFLFLLDPSVGKGLSARDWLRFAPEVLTTGWRNWGSAVVSALQALLPGDYTIYRRDTSNAWGDMQGQKGLTNRPILSPLHITYADRGFADGLQAYIDGFGARDIRVALLLAPFQRTCYEQNRPAIDAVAARARTLQGARLLLDLPDAVMDDTCFYDTAYHLDWPSAEAFTRRVIARARAQGLL
jgi:hypothetical protein